MKFDCIVGNPPYDRSLHLDIIRTVIPYGDRSIFIHPSRWISDNMSFSKKYRIRRYYDQIESDDIFDICTPVGLVISEFGDFENDEYSVGMIKFGRILDRRDIDILDRIRERVLYVKYESWRKHIVEGNSDGFRRAVVVRRFVGGSGGRTMGLQYHKYCPYVLENGVVVEGGHIGERFSDFFRSSYRQNYTVITEKPDDIYMYTHTGTTFVLQDMLFRFTMVSPLRNLVWMDRWCDEEFYDMFGLWDMKDDIERIVDIIKRKGGH